MYVLYLDQLFLLNFYVNTLIFFTSRILINKPLKISRMIKAGIGTALEYCLFLLVPFLKHIPSFLVSFIIPIGAILYLYPSKSYRSFLKIYMIHMGVAFLMGGATFSLWYVIGYSYMGPKMSVWFVCGIASLVTVILYGAFYNIRKWILLPYFEYTLEITYHHKSVNVKGLLDTGNLLYTPISHKPVMIMTYEAIESLLTLKEREAIVRYAQEGEEMFEKDWNPPQYFIPFNSVGCRQGILWGVEAECITFQKAQLKSVQNKCVIGIVMQPFFDAKDYQVLIHPELIIDRGN